MRRLWAHLHSRGHQKLVCGPVKLAAIASAAETVVASWPTLEVRPVECPWLSESAPSRARRRRMGLQACGTLSRLRGRRVVRPHRQAAAPCVDCAGL